MNYSDMKLPELKAIAKDRKIRGFSSMRKDELIRALTDLDKADSVAEAKINSALANSAKGNVKDLGDFTQYAETSLDAIVAGIRNDREARSNKGRQAGSGTTLTLKMHPTTKIMNYRLRNGSPTAKLTPRQAKRVRKTEAKFYNANRNNVCYGMGVNSFTYS